MKVIYIYHSGFVVELEDKNLVFDYYIGDIPKLNDKKTYVFASHNHSDHFNLDIFKLFSNAKFILSNDIPQSTDYISVSPNNEYIVDDLKIITVPSTDLGVAFLVKTKEGNIYHAGDLHLWHFEDDTQEEYKEMYNNYVTYISKLVGEDIKLAFTPVDNRLGIYTFEGLELFDKMINPKVIIPMHMQENYSIVDNYNNKKLIKLRKKGDIYEI